MKMTLNVNGKPVAIAADDPQMPLLYALRDDLGLHGPRFGCGLGQCGACTVLVDGKAMRSCVMPVATLAGKKIVTLEGLGGPGQLHPLQKAFIDEQAVQYGHCINGMIMPAAALLQTNKRPTEQDIKAAPAEDMWRGGSHLRILRAIKRVSDAAA